MILDIHSRFLKSFSTYKSSYRKEEWDRQDKNNAPYDTLVIELINLGYLKKNKAGSVMMAKKGYDETGSFHGAQAQAKRKMQTDFQRENLESWHSTFGGR